MRYPAKLSAIATATVLALTLCVTPASVGQPPGPAGPGAPGAGDPYFPRDGNGGYDVGHYDLALRYRPGTDVLVGRATINATATMRLSRFNLDLVGLRVRSITVNDAPATWSRGAHELRVVPRHPLRGQRPFTVRVRYRGVPRLTTDIVGPSGFVATDDGFDVAGEPHVAATWFPVNDHPSDKASYTFRVTVPRGRKVVANGDLVRRSASGRWRTWTWRADDPMASYLATVDVGRFRTHSYRRGGIRYFDAIDPDLFDPLAVPSTGRRFAFSQAADGSYKRLTHTIDVPAGGATVGFTTTRDTDPDFDFMMVEAHTVGEDDWTTLRDLNGHTSQATGGCLQWPDLHPFIAEHYQTIDPAAETCTATGATGAWWAASGASDGPEEWRVDLTPFAGSTVELSISYVSDGGFQAGGVTVDDVVVSTGEGSTSFEDGLEGWIVPGPPPGSPGNENDWIVGTAADGPTTMGEFAGDAFARQPEIIRFLSSVFGRYPWRSAGGIVDDTDTFGFALETQTRPIYAKGWFTNPIDAVFVVVHELAHQWYGDSLAVKRWRHIWLNEGFATYAEWLWSEREGFGTPQQIFDFFLSDDFAPADDPMWQVRIGNPGRADLFDFSVYFRGAMTLHQLRLAVGDADFFRILRVWAQSRAGDNVTTREFIRLSERISGERLHGLFRTWLYTPGRPTVPAAPPRDRSAKPMVPPAARSAAVAAREARSRR
jgi:hypothetical protein